MPLQNELQVYTAKVNLSLLNSTVAFILDMSEVTYAQRIQLSRKSPLLDSKASGSEFQEKYGFLYLGELLERYEERFGMTIQDLRAIALALGYTYEFTTNEMFVGNQKENFLRKVQKASDEDTYLTGALYLLDENRDGISEYRLKLVNMGYAATEDLLFALSLFDNHEQVFYQFRPQLLRLLGKGRTVSVLGNATIWSWVTMWLAPNLKGIRSKDMALFRALCALPTSHIKAGNRHYSILLSHGYAPLEISYASTMSILSQMAEGCLRSDSIATEKIVVDLFREVLSCENPMSPDVYDQLTQIYHMYERFTIKCYGHERMNDALKDGSQVQNVMTLFWFSELADICHPVFNSFDIMESKWDRLAAILKPEKYSELFGNCLSSKMSKEEVQHRLDRYRELTGRDYTDIYWDSTSGRCFSLLVNKGILDLWNLFQGSLDENGNVMKPDMQSNIWNYVHKIENIQAFKFFETFFETHGVAKLEYFFGSYRHRNFYESLTGKSVYTHSENIQLKLNRDYLDNHGHQQLLHWLEDDIFTYQPEQYISLVIAILRDDFASGLFSEQDQRELFTLVSKQPNISKYILDEIKRRYMTEDELQADRDAEAAAKLEGEQRQQAALVQSIREHYESLVTNSFFPIIKFLDEFRYHTQKHPIACRIAREGLDELLNAQHYELTGEEANKFLLVCAKLVKHKAMCFSEVQTYISRIKECAEGVTGH